MVIKTHPVTNRLLIDAQVVRQQVERLLVLYPDLADDLTLLADTLEGETQLFDILTGLVLSATEAGTYAEAIKAHEQMLAERRGRFERREEMFRTVILSLMQSANMTKLILAAATLSVSTRPPKPIVDDEASVPDKFCRVTRRPDMSAINTAVKAGENVPGIHMSNGSTSLTIRVK